MVERATFDATVIAEWTRRRTHSRRKSRRLWWVLAVLLVIAMVPVLLGMISPFPWVPVVGFCALGFGLALRFRYLAVIACPRCGERPLSPFARLPLWDFDYCPHCYYWLIDPRRGRTLSTGADHNR
jgi:hypothetical protein